MKRALAAAARGAKWLTIAGATAFAVAGVAYLAGIRVNTTTSVPRGLYWRQSAEPAPGALVMFCPPRSAPFDMARSRHYIGPGFCSGRYEKLIKHVLAAKGDIVGFSREGVTVNGTLLPGSVPMMADSGGRELRAFVAAPRVLGPDEFLLMGDASNPKSFDARYFGPIERSQIDAVLRPVYTW